MRVFIPLLDFTLREMQSSTLTLQKSPPTPRYGFTPFCRNERPTLPTLPPAFGLLVSSAKSTISLQGKNFFRFPTPIPSNISKSVNSASLTPSPTSASLFPFSRPAVHHLRQTASHEITPGLPGKRWHKNRFHKKMQLQVSDDLL